MRKALSLAIIALCLLGTGCSIQGNESKEQTQKTAEVDYFNKKIECNSIRASTEARVIKQRSWSHVFFTEICYSKKYNSCVIEYHATIKDGTFKEMNEASVTYFEDALTGRSLHSISSTQRDGDMSVYYKAVDDVDCAK